MATNDPRQVHVNWESIQGVLNEYGWDDLYLLFTQDGSPLPRDEGLAAAEDAMQRATAAVSEEVIFGRDVQPSPYGPVVWIDHLTSEDGLRTWLSVFASSLEGAGWSGRVGVPQTGLPERYHNRPRTRRPTAFVAYQLDVPGSNPSVPTRRPVTPWDTPALCRDAMKWALFEGAQAYVDTGSYPILFDLSHSDEILAWLADFGGAGLTFLRMEPFRICEMTLMGRVGQCVYQLDDERLDWVALVGEITQPLIRHPDALDLAFVRMERAGVNSWFDIKGPPLPHVSENEFVANRHLWDQFVPDVHGIQLLTEAHLARAGNLDAWDVQRLTPGRYLVQAKDLGPWFAGEETDPDILAAARQDFHNMLLTYEVIETHRRP